MGEFACKRPKEKRVEAKKSTMRKVGGWSIAMGTIILTVGVAVGVGCVVAGGSLLKASAK